MFVSGGVERRSSARARARGGGPRRGGRRCSSATSPAAAKIPALCTVPPPSRRRCDARRRDRLGVAGEQRAERRAQALVQAQRDRVGRRGERRERARRARPPRSAAARRRGGRGAVRRAAAASASVRATSETVPPAPRVRVLEAEQRRARRSDARSTVGLEPAASARPRRLGPRARDPVASLTRMCAAPIDDRRGPGAAGASSAARFATVHVGTKTAASLPSSSRPAPLQLVHVLVLARDRPAEPRRAHRLPHLVRGSGAEVRPQVDAS